MDTEEGMVVVHTVVDIEGGMAAVGIEEDMAVVHTVVDIEGGMAVVHTVVDIEEDMAVVHTVVDIEEDMAVDTEEGMAAVGTEMALAAGPAGGNQEDSSADIALEAANIADRVTAVQLDIQD